MVASAYLAYVYKFGIEEELTWNYMAAIFAGAFFSAMCFYLFPLYHAWRGITLLAEYRIVFIAWCSQYLLLVIAGFLLKVSGEYSREWLVGLFLIGLFLLLTYRLFLRIMLSHYRKMGFNQRSVCLITHGSYGESIYKNIVTKPELGFHIKAVFSDRSKTGAYKKDLFGKIDDCFAWLRRNEVDQLWIAVPLEKMKIVQKITHEMRHKTTDIRLVPDLGSYNLLNHSITEIAGMPLINLSVSPMQENYNRVLKRCEDVIVASLILLLISPLLLIIAIIIKCTSKGPVFYRQVRVGLNNDPFVMLKFRSMPIDAGKENRSRVGEVGREACDKIWFFLETNQLR